MKVVISSCAVLSLIAAASVLAGCGAPGSRPNTGIGPIAGGVSTGLVGGAVGKSLDEEERRQLALASELAAEQIVVRQAPSRRVPWKRTNPQTNAVTASGWVVPKTDPYQRPDGTTCRDVTQSVSKSGQTQSEDVTLCRTQVAQADGSNWVIPQ